MPIRRNGLTDRYKDLIKGEKPGGAPITQPLPPTPVQSAPYMPSLTPDLPGRKDLNRIKPIPPTPFEPVQPPQPPAPQPMPPTDPNIPQQFLEGMPDISGLGSGINQQWVRDMWSNLYNPESGWSPQMAGTHATGWGPGTYSGVGYEQDPLAHAQQIFGWSPEQISEVWGTLGWGSPSLPRGALGFPDEPQIAGPGTPPPPPGLSEDVNLIPITPELEGLKHAGGGVGGGISTPPTQVQPREFPSYGGDMTEWLNMLKQPITADVGLRERERQQIYNQARGQVQGATRTGMEQMREMMGGRGFRAGESGIADTAIGGVARAGQQGLQNVSQNIAITEAQNRFAQNMALNQANLQRMGLGGQMALGGRGQDVQRELGWGGLDVTQRGQDITQQLGLGGLDLGYAGLDVQRELGQGQLGLGGQQLDWQKEMFGQTFPYQQEMDALSMLMNLYGMQTQSQQYRWNPYWQSLLQ